MKTIAVILAVILGAYSLNAQFLRPVDGRSSVTFTLKNFGVSTGGDFKGLEGRIAFDPSNPAAAEFDVSVSAATVNTDMDVRDSHLRRQEYFDVAHYPKISFVATKVSNTGHEGRFTLDGKITIKGITKAIAFPFTAAARENGYLFEGSFRINRRDFNVGGNSLVLGDEVTVNLSVFAGRE